MPDPVTFRHPALTRAYANAERSMARLPEAERNERLADLATRLTSLDARTDLSEADLGREAARLVTTALPSGPAGGPTPVEFPDNYALARAISSGTG